MDKPKILHLVDDVTPGGVMRVLDHMTRSATLGEYAEHHHQRIAPTQVRFDIGQADLIVSHLSLNWRNFLSRTHLRACHPNLPMVHVEHSYTQAFTAHNVHHKPRFYAMLRSAFGLFDHVVAVSDAQRDWMLNRRFTSPKKLTAIPSAVDLADFAKLPPPARPATRFGLIGRLHICKGFDLAIEAFMSCENCRLRLEVFGDGPERSALEALASSDPRITFHGHSNDPLAPMRSVDAVLMPSRWESYGLVAQEALAAGRKVLASHVDGLKSQEPDGVHLVPDYSATTWRQHIETLAQLPSIPYNDADVPHLERILPNGRFERSWNQLFQKLLSQ